MIAWVKSWLFRGGQGNIALLRRLLVDYGPRYFKLYVAAYVLMGLAGVCTGLTAYMAGSATNAAYVYHSFEGVIAVCVAIIVIFAVKGLSSYGQSVLLARIANAITAENQRRSFDKLLQESLGFFSDRHSSEFMARIGFCAASAAAVLNLLVTTFGKDLISLLSLVAVMITQDPFLSLIGLLIMPPSLLAVRKLMKRVQHIMLTQFTGSARILETMQETIQGLRIIKAFNLEHEMRRRIYQDVGDVERASNKMARVSNRSSPVMETLGGFAIALVFLYAGYRVLETGAAPGEFFAFITAFLLAYEPAKRIARFNVDLSSSIVGVQILYELLDSAPTEPDETNKPSLIVSAGNVQFSSVNFSYRLGEPVLQEMSFVADAGRVTALVGHSGGGKSTILNLLLRFYEAQGGSITIDGTDIFTISRSSLRQQIAYVGQDIFLFKGTIRDNIIFGRIDADEETIIAAAKAAFAHEFILAFPLGYDTPVGEHGVQLSLGQRQRIAVARALIKDAPIIVLDEPTASLDSESERKVHEAISLLCQGRTTLVIAHRLYTIVNADCIYVIEQGSVVESGQHSELLLQGGRYADFFRAQFRDQKEERFEIISSDNKVPLDGQLIT